MKKFFLSAPRFISFLTILFFIGAVPRVKAQVTCTQTETFKPYSYGNWQKHVSMAAQFTESASPAPNSRPGVLKIQSSNANSQPYTSADPSHAQNLQGGIYTLKNSNVVVLKAEVYISQDFMTNRRRTDMWGIANGDQFTVYGELAFRNIDGKSPDIFYWDGMNEFKHTDIKVIANTWYLFEMRINEKRIEYYVNNKYVGKLSTNNFIYNFSHLAFHNYNFNDPALPKKQYDPTSNYTSYWDKPMALCGVPCAPDQVVLYHDCVRECVPAKEKDKKLKETKHWRETPCPAPTNSTTVSNASLRGGEGLEVGKPGISEGELPTKLIISNYPNPFAGKTTIQYQIPVAGKVSLKVYDILGRPVTTLVDGPKTQGTFKVDFNASKFSKGNYFYRIIVNTNDNKQLTRTGNMNVIGQ